MSKFECWIDRCEEINPAKPDHVIEGESEDEKFRLTIEDVCHIFQDLHGWQSSWEGLIVHDVRADQWHSCPCEMRFVFEPTPAQLSDFIG